ncbi:MAG: SOS response-associated peptidase family protein [Rhodoferax sp.]|uniref:SOS response-associated peptidase family protein n=1 Tax=Rhodoferax sp. TaxID=50421 RepID=UPI002731CC1C|nr:SOS response-associated peptidase family protein [Rhodoferax sp.]MDP1528480.1 SOS response-associated peptidase family protein [Rhodoferax sp.]
MCNTYRFTPLADQPFEEFREIGIQLEFPGGKPNIEPRDDIRIGDMAPVVTRTDGGVAVRMTKWAWKSPQGRPVFNYRSDDRSFADSLRCAIPADGFYEFTDALPGQKRKTKWLFTLIDRPAFWIAGVIRDGAFAMLTTAPGPDVAPYHDRQIVLLEPDRAMEWLDLTRPGPDILRSLPAGRLAVERVFPPVETGQLFD